MNLSDVIGRDVVDRDGRRVGRVVDVRVRLVRTETDEPLMRVERVVVARWRFGGRLGYDRAKVQGPWLFRTALRSLHRGGRAVAIDDVDLTGTGPVPLDVTLAQLADLPPHAAEPG